MKAKHFVKTLAIAATLVFPTRLLEGKTYDAELTQSVAQILDARYANDTTEIGKEWRIISVKENITANDVYDFLSKYLNARRQVEEVCPTYVLGLAELIRRQNLEKPTNNGGNGGVNIGTGEQVKPQTNIEEISQEARYFFAKTIEVGNKKMSALDYLIKCGYLPGEIEAIYRKIKRDWGNETPRLSKEFLDSYARQVTGRVLPYPSEKEPELTQEQMDSLGGWALDTLKAVFEKSVGGAKKYWDNYYKWGDKSLDGIYTFCLDIRSLYKEGTKERKVIEKVINAIWPHTKEHKRTGEEMNSR